MIKHVVILGVFVASTSFAGFSSVKKTELTSQQEEASVQVANVYSCEAADGTKVSYNGAHRAHVLKIEKDTYSEDLSYATSTQSAMGELVTAYVTNIADATIDYTLVLPNVLVSKTTPSIDLETMLIRTFTGTFMGPMNFPGVSRNNEYISVKCTAEYEAPAANE